MIELDHFCPSCSPDLHARLEPLRLCLHGPTHTTIFSVSCAQPQQEQILNFSRLNLCLPRQLQRQIDCHSLQEPLLWPSRQVTL